MRQRERHNLAEILDISGSIVTIDAIGTQTAVMEQIHEQEGHFVLTVKKNQPEAYEEISQIEKTGTEMSAGRTKYVKMLQI